MRTYSPRDFLRRTSNEMLRRYFLNRQLLPDVAFDQLRESEVDEIFDAWHRLDDEDVLAVDADFREIESIAHAGGEQTLLDEARYHGVDLTDVFRKLGGFHDRALHVFLELPSAFEVALRFEDADRAPQRYWRKRKGLPRIEAAVDEAASRRLAGALSAYLRRAEGRGYHCAVEVYRRGEHDYFFAFPEDYGAIHLEYNRGALERRRSRPAFEIIFVYSKGAGTLDTFFQGDRKKVTELQAVFGREVLRSDLGALTGADKVFNLNALKRRDHPFVYSAASGIVDVRIRKLRLTAMGAVRDRVTLEVDPTTSRFAIHDSLEQHFLTEGTPPSTACPKTPLSLMNVTQAGLVVSFARDGRRGRSTRTFDISHPNACPLGHDGRDGAIRQMLIDSGIEPRQDEAAESA